MRPEIVALGLLAGMNCAFGAVIDSSRVPNAVREAAPGSITVPLLPTKNHVLISRCKTTTDIVIPGLFVVYSIGTNGYRRELAPELSNDDWAKGDRFYFNVESTHCSFNVDKSWFEADLGEAFGHADCLNQQNIKGYKRDDPGQNEWFRTLVDGSNENVQCAAFMEFKWEGDL